MNDHPADLPALAPVRRYADGATVLVRRPQAGAAWSEVREGWWWHLVGMVLVPVAYPVAALTVWQQPSRQPLARRLAWATLLTLGAYLLVGLPAFVVFSQRWYALHRSATTPEDAGLAAVDPAAASGYCGTVATVGRRIVDAVTGVLPGADVPVAVPMLAEPWGSLRDEAATAARRLDRLDVVALGPAGPAVARARGEAVAAFGSVARTAAQGAAVDQVLAGMGTEALERRLGELEGRRGSADDLAAAHRSLRDQLAIAERLEATVEELEGRLHRTVAQLGEAAARAEELVVCPPSSPEAGTHALGTAVDGLHAVRAALEAVELADVATDLRQVG